MTQGRQRLSILRACDGLDKPHRRLDAEQEQPNGLLRGPGGRRARGRATPEFGRRCDRPCCEGPPVNQGIADRFELGVQGHSTTSPTIAFPQVTVGVQPGDLTDEPCLSRMSY
jgi:hypothetical protein